MALLRLSTFACLGLPALSAPASARTIDEECLPGDACAVSPSGGALLQVTSKAKQELSEVASAALASANRSQLALVARDAGMSEEQAGNIFTCFFVTCLNFLNDNREDDCNACAVATLDAIKGTPVGANDIAAAYATDMLSVKSKGYIEAWCDGTMLGCSRKVDFPGPGTSSVMGWDNVKNMVSQYPSKEWSGEWWRGNELGFIINNAVFWSGRGIDPISIGLGWLPSQHAAVRPLIEEMFTMAPGSARYREVQGIVSSSIDAFLNRAKSTGMKVVGDLKVLVHQILNRVALGRTVTWEYAEEFIELQSEVVTLGTVSQLLPPAFYGYLQDINKKIIRYVNEYAAIIERKYGSQLATKDCSPSDSCVRQLASGVYDALYAAGGLSVPSTMSTGLGVLFSKHSSNPFPGASALFSKALTSDEARAFYWENIRFFPPVVGFPHWETRPTCAGKTASETAALQGADGTSRACPKGDDDDRTGYPHVNQYQGGIRVVPNLALAGFDPAKWGADADQFKVRQLSEYDANSLGFAEAAVDNSVANGGMNRDCPAKDFALMIGATFFEKLHKDDWAVPRTDIEFGFGPVFVSDFTLSSKKMVRECNEVCPCSLSTATACASCEADKLHCKLCRDCRRNPPRWWDFVRRVACSSC